MLVMSIAAALVVGALWTCITGGWWHWAPILAALTIALLIRKALEKQP